MKVGIALPVTKAGFYKPNEVLELHLKKSIDAGAVYFSTDNRISSKKACLVDFVLLVNKDFSYLADLEEYINFEEKGAPSDAKFFAPEPFVQDENLHWFKISNIKEISKEKLNLFKMDNEITESKYHGVGNYVQNTGRLQVFYFKKFNTQI